jgi:hypothetical protein
MIHTFPLLGITERRLKEAEIISAADRNDRRFHVQLWGRESVPPRVPCKRPSREMDEVRIELDSKRPEQFQDLLCKVESAKGRLSEDLRHLRTEG